MISVCFKKNKNKDYISEPIIRRCFAQNLCHFVHFGAVSLIHSALEINAATLRKVLAPFSFSHVTDSCSLFISFLIFLSFFLNFITIIVVEFLIKLTILPQNFVYAVQLYNKFITNIRDKHS